MIWLSHMVLSLPLGQSPSPTPTPIVGEATTRTTPMVLWLVLALLAAAVLLGLSMRRHLRRVPVDLDVATRAAARSADGKPSAASGMPSAPADE